MNIDDQRRLEEARGQRQRQVQQRDDFFSDTSRPARGSALSAARASPLKLVQVYQDGAESPRGTAVPEFHVQNMTERMEGCDTAGSAGDAGKECSNGCGLVLGKDDVDKEHDCITQLRAAIQMLRSEMLYKLEEQRRQMEQRLDSQRGHMERREAALQRVVQELKEELARVSQKVKLLMDIEVRRSQDLEKMQQDRLQMMEALDSIKRDQDQNKQKCHQCATRNATPGSSPATGGSGSKVTTL